MKLLTAVVFSLVLPLCSFGASVKILSTHCGSTSGAREGSGIPFQHGGKVYVLTSQAKVFHDNGSFCHWVLPSGSSLKSAATLLTADWGMGLALLEVSAVAPDSTLPKLNDLQGAVAIVGESVTVSGFGLGQSTEAVDNGASVLLASGDRHSIPTLSSTIEILGGHFDGGMVGAPVTTRRGQLLGILSQQYLKMTPGTSTRPHEWDEAAGHVEDHVLVIPASAIFPWVSQYFVAPSQSPYFVEAQAQEKNLQEVSSGSLKFSLSCPPASSGGGGGGPIGGGDGVGVGGSADVAPFCSAALMEVPAKTVWPYPWLQSWADALTETLKKGRKLTLTYFVGRSSANGILNRAPIWSLADAFTLLKHASLTPVLVKAPLAGENLPAKVMSLRKDGLVCMDLAKSLFGFLDIPELRLLMREVYLSSELLQSEAWELVTKADVDGLLDLHGRHKAAWDILLEYQAQPTADLRAGLGRIRGLLPR